MALKIKCGADGRVAKETMDVFLRFGRHKQNCALCDDATKTAKGEYCAVGEEMIRLLALRPDVEFVAE